MPYKDPFSPENIEKSRAAKRRHYHANKEAYLARNRAKKAELVAMVRERKDVPCVDCDTRYPYYVMHFDHLDGDAKVDNIARMISGLNKSALLKEMDKCEVVCANCHAERTHRRLQEIKESAL